MALIETWIKTDLKSIISVKYIRGNLFSQDNMANLIGVELLENGEPANVSGTVSANVLRADGATVAVSGTLSGNMASVTLPQAAYAVPGMLSVAVKLTSGSTITTIGAIQAIVYRTSSDTIVDPGTIIPSVEELINRIDAAVASIPPDYSALSNQVSTNTTDISGLKTATSDLPTMRTNIAANTEDVSSLKSAMETKAEIDGYYEEMTVGDAEQLIATQFVENSEPYKFRTTGGSADVGNRAYMEKIVGGTIAWNQLAENGNFQSATRWTSGSGTLAVADGEATVTFSGSAWNNDLRQYRNFVAGHKILFVADIKCSAGLAGQYVVVGTSGGTATAKALATSYATFAGIAIAVANDYLFRIGNRDGWASFANESFTVKNFNVFDLTQMFGSTIADAIYTAEQANAGAGVAWFRALFPEPYYAYNAGELISVSGLESKVTVGLNAYNPATGKAELVGGKQYQITGAYTGLTVDGETVTPDNNGLFTPAGNGKIELTVTGGNDSDTCVHLVWSGQRNGEYEPYQAHSYPLDDSIMLRGIPKWVDGKLTFNGDEYLPDGTVNRRYKMVKVTSIQGASARTNGDIYGQIVGTTDAKSAENNTVGNAVCNVCQTVSATVKYNGAMSAISVRNGYVDICIAGITSADALNSYLASNDVYIIYELATPTEETAEPFAAIQIVDDFGTEEYISGTICPVGHETRYPVNLRDKLQHLPDLASADGYYVIQQTGSQMSLVHFRIPQAPTEDGTYILKATVSNGTPTYTWESEE